MEIIKTDNDFTTTVEKALDEINKNWRNLPGVVVAGSHTPILVEEKIELIRKAREANLPFLGLCMGFQLMLIEYARNVLDIKDATSEEIGQGSPIIKKMPKLRVGLFPVGDGMESFWHNYKFNPIYTFDFRKDWKLVFEQEVLVVAKLKENKFHIGTQFHPEYQSSKDKPHLILKEFLHAATMAM